jgi:sugar phosphate isomerase/epimerase
MSKLTINDFSPLDPPVVGHTAFTAITPSPAPHRNSWRAAQDEIARAASELARLRAEIAAAIHATWSPSTTIESEDWEAANAVLGILEKHGIITHEGAATT